MVWVIRDICKELKKSDKSYHLFILSSTVMPKDIEDNFIPHGSRGELLALLGLDEEGILNHILSNLKKYE